MTNDNDVNKVTLVGFVFKEPELRFMPSGDAAAKFVLSTTKRYQFKGEDKKKITFHIILAYGKCAEGIKYGIGKNSRVKVEGSINNRKWQDPKTNAPRYVTEIIATLIEVIDYGKKTTDCTPEQYVSARLSVPSESNNENKTQSISMMFDDSDIPF